MTVPFLNKSRATALLESRTAGFLLLVAGLLPCVPGGLTAGPVLKIESVATEAYPEIQARVTLHHPYPEQVLESESHFTVRERAGEAPAFGDATLRTIQELPAPTTRLYLVLVVDTTRSIPPAAFKTSIDTAAALVGALTPGESAAIYRISARPLLASGFVSDQSALVKTLRELVRDGRVTRLYDSLHSAVITAHRTALAVGRERPPGIREKTAIILLTDGRDEGSFLTDNDCVELAALSHSYDIPVYTILYGNSKNLAALTRLSARTGGELIRGFDQKRIQSIPETLRKPLARHFRLGYRTNADPGSYWPIGAPVQVQIGWNITGSRDAAESSYLIPFPRGLLLYARRDGLPLALATGGALLVGLLLLLVLFLILRERSNRRWRRELAAQQAAVVLESGLLHGEDLLPAPVLATAVTLEGDEEEPARTGPAPAAPDDDDDFFIQTPGELETQAAKSSRPVEHVERPRRAHDAAYSAPYEGVSEDDALYAADLARERQKVLFPVRESAAGLYMRDYSYRMLQNALRQARRYAEASVKRETGHGQSEYDIFLETTIIGTGRWASIHLEDPSASPIHAKIRQVDHKFVIYDMLSAAGVYLNGRKILRPMPLADGDRIQLGRTVLVFRGLA